MRVKEATTNDRSVTSASHRRGREPQKKPRQGGADACRAVGREERASGSASVITTHACMGAPVKGIPSLSHCFCFYSLSCFVAQQHRFHGSKPAFCRDYRRVTLYPVDLVGRHHDSSFTYEGRPEWDGPISLLADEVQACVRSRPTPARRRRSRHLSLSHRALRYESCLDKTP